MKKILFMALGAGLLLTSCQSDEPFAPGEGGEKQVSFTLSVPETMGTRAGSGNKSAVGGVRNNQDSTIYYTLALYNGETLESQFTEEATASTVEFNPTVILGRNYTVVAYANLAGKEDDLTEIEVTKKFNDEGKDAYFVYEDKKFTEGDLTQNLTLTRPFGKLRLVATDYAKLEGKNAEIANVEVNYANELYTIFNAKNGEFSTTAANSYTWTWTDTYYTDEEGEKTIFADYIPVPANGEYACPFTITVNYKSGEKYTRKFTQDIPVKRNGLTTLKGDFFTSNATISVTVKDDFESGVSQDIKLVGSAADLQAALNAGGEIILMNDITSVESFKVTKNTILNLNGKTINAGKKYVSGLTGADVCAIVVLEGAELIINGEGTVTTSNGYYGVYAKNGTLTIKGGEYVAPTSAVQLADATVVIEGGKFSNTEDDKRYVINCLDANYNNRTAIVSIKGGQFYKFNPANNAAEGAGTNFVADGYSSVKSGENYVVVEGDIDAIAATADELVGALENGENVLLTGDIDIIPANMSNAYGTTGLNVKNGQTIDGGGHTIDISGANGTWDSGISTTGGLIKNLTVTGSFRGIFVNHNSAHSEKVVLENVIIDGTTYTISCDQGTNKGLEATDCTFNGWTSYAGTLGEAKFVDCSFGEGKGYKFMRPYATTTYVNCDFCEGYTVDPRAAVTFVNCRVNGVSLTEANKATLVSASYLDNATVE